MILHDLKTDGAQRLLSYWSGLRGDRIVPRYGDVDLVQIAPILPNTLIYSRDNEGDFGIHFFGTGLVERFGRDLTGEKLKGVMDGATAEKSLAQLRDVVEGPSVLITWFRSETGQGQSYEIEQLYLPLEGTDGRITAVLSYARSLMPDGTSQKQDSFHRRTFAVESLGNQQITGRRLIELR